ncbi:MAG: IS3 family transposase, partial [Pyramidobacter sp.]|nr:IS3 family transposase [Pyramidobacter sp.]
MPRYCKIFYPKLEGGEAQISRHRTLQEEISGYSSLFLFGSLSQRILCWRKQKFTTDKDSWLIRQIKTCQQQSNYTYGCRRVQLWIEKQCHIRVNLKAVLRVMRKIDALAQVRRRRAYTSSKEAVHRYENILKRQFAQTEPNRFWATDITYILTRKGMAYLCAVIDQCGKMVLNYRIGTEMTSSLVIDTIAEALKQEKVTDGLVLHSDQG